MASPPRPLPCRFLIGIQLGGEDLLDLSGGARAPPPRRPEHPDRRSSHHLDRTRACRARYVSAPSNECCAFIPAVLPTPTAPPPFARRDKRRHALPDPFGIPADRVTSHGKDQHSRVTAVPHTTQSTPRRRDGSSRAAISPCPSACPLRSRLPEGTTTAVRPHPGRSSRGPATSPRSGLASSSPCRRATWRAFPARSGDQELSCESPKPEGDGSDGEFGLEVGGAFGVAQRRRRSPSTTPPTNASGSSDAAGARLPRWPSTRTASCRPSRPNCCRRSSAASFRPLP